MNSYKQMKILKLENKNKLVKDFWKMAFSAFHCINVFILSFIHIQMATETSTILSADNI